MEALYTQLPAWDEATRTALWERWLWESDCTAPPLERCFDMNEMHMLGVLVCVGEWHHPVPLYARGECIAPETTGGGDASIGVIHLHPHIPVALLSVRETMDQIECLQLHWGPVLSECGHVTALQLLRALMARLGELASHAYPLELDGVVVVVAAAAEAEAAAAAAAAAADNNNRGGKKRRTAPTPEKKKVLDDPQHATPLPIGLTAAARVGARTMRRRARMMKKRARTMRRATHRMMMPAGEAVVVVEAEEEEEEEEDDHDDEDDTTHDDSSSSGEEDDNDNDVGRLGLLSRKSLRQSICVLLALLRVQRIVSRAVEAPPASAAEEHEVVCALRQHHIEASMDLFNDLQQMVHLAPGQRLAYRTAFHGMYNHVSQVVYFHHPRFCRGAQLDLARIPSSPLHMVPLVMQLLPEIALAYDDDAHVPGLTPSRRTANNNSAGAAGASAGASAAANGDGASGGAAAANGDDATGGGEGGQRQKKQTQQKKGGGWHWLVCCGAFFLLVRAPFFL
jgi:hypothetical protein